MKVPFIRRFLTWGATLGFGICLPLLLTMGGLWLIGAALAYSLLRIHFLKIRWASLPRDLLAIAAGIGSTILLLAVSLPAAVAAFVLTQLIYEWGFLEAKEKFFPDRFEDSYKTAEKILKSLAG